MISDHGYRAARQTKQSSFVLAACKKLRLSSLIVALSGNMHTLISCHLNHVPLPPKKAELHRSGPPLADGEEIQVSEDAFLLTTDRRGGLHDSNACRVSDAQHLCRALWLCPAVCKLEEEHDLRRRRERMGPGEKAPNPGGRATDNL